MDVVSRRMLVAAALVVVTAACTRELTATEPAVPATSTITTTTTSTTAPGTATTAAIIRTTTTTTTATSATRTTTSPPGTTTTPATTTTTTTTTMSAPTATAPGTTALPAPGSTGSLREIRLASDIPPPPLPADWVVESIGTSVQGRDIVSWSRRIPDARRTVLVVGAVHGNEPASPPTVRSLVTADLSADVEVWLVPEMNPDGVAAGTRWNANGVDLNRNFPWGWRADDGGPGPLSEPETGAITALVDRIDPDLVVWVHQPYGYVTSVGGSDDGYEASWSAGSGLPVRPDVTQHGGGESWAHFEAGLDSVLVEIDTWEATPDIVTAQRAGFEAVLAALD